MDQVAEREAEGAVADSESCRGKRLTVDVKNIYEVALARVREIVGEAQVGSNPTRSSENSKLEAHDTGEREPAIT